MTAPVGRKMVCNGLQEMVVQTTQLYIVGSGGGKTAEGWRGQVKLRPKMMYM